jgi:hypothetical protein
MKAARNPATVINLTQLCFSANARCALFAPFNGALRRAGAAIGGSGSPGFSNPRLRLCSQLVRRRGFFKSASRDFGRPCFSARDFMKQSASTPANRKREKFAPLVGQHPICGGEWHSRVWAKGFYENTSSNQNKPASKRYEVAAQSQFASGGQPQNDGESFRRTFNETNDSTTAQYRRSCGPKQSANFGAHKPLREIND